VTEIILETHGLTKITLALDPEMMLLDGLDRRPRLSRRKALRSTLLQNRH
jgi:hypothetical protein